MKNSFFLMCLLSTAICYGQSAKKNELSYEYVQKPLVKIDQNWKYLVNVTQANKEDIQERQTAFEEKQKSYDETFDKELESYNNSKAAGKLLTGKPVRKVVQPSFLGSVLDTDLLANSIVVEGFDKDDNGNFIVEVVIEGFAISSSEKVLDEKKSERYYKTVYRNPITVTVTDKSNNSVLWSKQFYSDPRETKFLKRSSEKSAYEMEKEWNENKISLKKGLEDRIIKEDMKAIKAEINDQIGYPNKSLEMIFFSAKGKKFDYSEIESSITNVKKAFLTLKSDSEMAMGLLNKSKEVWLKELGEKNVDDKKARINKKITTALYVNLGYVSMIQAEFAKAKEYSLEAELVRPGMGVLTGESMKLTKYIEEFEKRD
ncbi:MAG: hypothetical protein NXI20_03740 [bacterium]|nr:hypothetical protein [bacterium]